MNQLIYTQSQANKFIIEAFIPVWQFWGYLLTVCNARPPAMLYRLESRTACKIPKGCQGARKWPMEIGLPSSFWVLRSTFLIEHSSYGKHKTQTREDEKGGKKGVNEKTNKYRNNGHCESTTFWKPTACVNRRFNSQVCARINPPWTMLDQDAYPKQEF